MIWDIFQRSLILFVHLQIVMFCIDRVNSNVIVGKKASMRGGFWGFWTIGPLSLILLPIHDKHRTTNIEQWTTIKTLNSATNVQWTSEHGTMVVQSLIEAPWATIRWTMDTLPPANPPSLRIWRQRWSIILQITLCCLSHIAKRLWSLLLDLRK